jgi:hypothetical protein
VKKLTLQNLSEKMRKIFGKAENCFRSCALSQKKTKAFLTLVVLALLSGFMFVEVMSAAETSISVSNTGTISTVGVGVYWDSGYTNKTSAINWGTLQPGVQRSFTVYIRNEGNVAITLSKSTTNWSPSATSNYLNLAWNYNGQTINPGASVQVALTLTVSASITGVTNFNFDITIMGSG